MRALLHALPRGALAGSLVLALGLGPSAGHATEWSLTGSVGQFFEGNSNPDLEEDNAGAAYGSVTRLNLTLGAQTARTSWSLSSGAAISQFGGPGATSDLNKPNPNASGRMRYRGQRFDLGAGFGFSRLSTSFIEFNTEAVIAAIEEEGDDFDGIVILPEDDLLIERSAVRSLYTLGADARYRLTRRNSLTVSGTGTISRFSENVGGLTDNSSYAFAVGFDHSLTPLSGIGVTARYRSFMADNLEETDGRSASLGLSYRTRPTRATDLRLNLGAAYTSVREFETLDGTERRTTDTDLSFSGGLSGTYSGTRDTRVSFGANHAVRPSSDGDLVNVTSFGGSINYNLTRLASLSVAASHSVSSEIGAPGGSDLDQSFVLGPTFTYRFAPDWSASLGYTFRFVDDEFGTAFGNRVFLGVTRSLRFFP